MKVEPLAAAVMAGILLAGPADAQTRRYAGRPVADVLKALESPKLAFIFTNDRVPQALLVKSEPNGRTDHDIAEQILAEHCLALKRGQGRLMIVVPAPGKCPAAAKPVNGGAGAPESINMDPPLRVTVIVPGQAGQAGQLSNPASREGVYSVAPSTVREMAGALDNVFHALEKLPSVTAVPGDVGKLAVRGAGPEHNMLLVDGVQIHNPYRLAPFFAASFLNPATAAGVKLDPSGLDARYGGRLSSVTSIDLRDGATDRALAVSGSLGLTAGDLLLEGRLPGNAGASWWAQARGTYFRPMINRVRDEQVAGFGDAQFRVTLLPTTRTRLTLYGLVGREMSDEPDHIYPANVFGIRTPDNKLFVEGPEYTGINRLGVMNFSWMPGPKLTATTTASTYGHEARERDVSQVSTPPYERDLGVRDHSLRQRVVFSPGSNRLFDTGVEIHSLQSQWLMTGSKPWARHENANGPRPRGLGPTTEGELVEYTDGPIDDRLARTQIGWWAQYRLPLGSRMALEPGVRLDWNSFTSEAVWQPRVRLSGSVRSSNWWTGYAEQAQTPSHESLQGYDYVQLTAADGERLKSERSRQIVAGVERPLPRAFALRFEAYWRRFDRLLVQRLETDAQRALRLSRLQVSSDLPADSMVYEPRPTVVADSIGSGSSNGLEVLLERTAGVVKGFVSYSYGRSTREMYGDTFLFDFDSPHSVKAVLFMQPWRRVRVAVTSQRASGVPVTPLISESFYRKSDGSVSMTMNPLMRRPSLRNTERLNGYGRTDVRVTWSRFAHWEIYGEMLNVFGEENFVHRFEMPTSVGPRETDGNVARSDVWVPSFGLRVKF
ncbi:MAG TPA: TonB-dependent receptor [Vicinamibacterales bacterium]|nr:TonB-dependent receptor [Vicinamibacterales bacterium]